MSLFHIGVIIAFALDIKPPSGQLGGQTNILPALANGDGEGIVRNYDFHGPVVFINDHPRNLRRRQRIADIFGRVDMIGNNVDFLAFELLDHILDPASPHSHAGTHRINIRIIGRDSEFGAYTRFTDSPHD